MKLQLIRKAKSFLRNEPPPAEAVPPVPRLMLSQANDGLVPRSLHLRRAPSRSIEVFAPPSLMTDPGGATPTSSSRSGSLYGGRSAEMAGPQLQQAKRMRRSSSKSLKMLTVAVHGGQIPPWDHLPPSPAFHADPLLTHFLAWSREAARLSERDQRTRLVQELRRVLEQQAAELIVRDISAVTDLPDKLGNLTQLTRLEIVGAAVVALPDLSRLVRLEYLSIRDCPRLRRLPFGLELGRTDLVIDLQNLPQLYGPLRTPTSISFARAASTWPRRRS